LLEVGWDIVADERQLLVELEVDGDVVDGFLVDSFGADVVVGDELERGVLVELMVELDAVVFSRQ
jgi:hypothetical protein